MINEIHIENCLDTMRRMPDGFIDLTVTSPPYDNLRDYKGYFFPFEDIAQELYRVTKPGGVVVWIVGDATVNGSETGTSFRQALYFKDVCGFNLHDTMIYNRHNMPIFGDRYDQEFEFMFILSKGRVSVFNPIMKKNTRAGAIASKTCGRKVNGTQNTYAHAGKPVNDFSKKGNIWKYEIGINCTTTDRYAFDHPAMFPEKLARDHIVSWSNPGDIVYDPFGGSGTTAKMAIKEKRQWILSEISEEYAAIAARRVDEATRQLTLF